MHSVILDYNELRQTPGRPILDQFVDRSWRRCKKLPPRVHCRALWGLHLTGRHLNLFSFYLWGLLSERGKKPFATGLVFWLFISPGTGSFWRRRGQTLTVNGSHAGQLVSEFQAERRGRARKFKETLRGGIRPPGEAGEENVRYGWPQPRTILMRQVKS